MGKKRKSRLRVRSNRRVKNAKARKRSGVAHKRSQRRKVVGKSKRMGGAVKKTRRAVKRAKVKPIQKRKAGHRIRRKQRGGGSNKKRLRKNVGRKGYRRGRKFTTKSGFDYETFILTEYSKEAIERTIEDSIQDEEVPPFMSQIEVSGEDDEGDEKEASSNFFRWTPENAEAMEEVMLHMMDIYAIQRVDSVALFATYRKGWKNAKGKTKNGLRAKRGRRSVKGNAKRKRKGKRR